MYRYTVHIQITMQIFVHPATSDYLHIQTEDSACRFTNLLLNKLVVRFLKP